MSVYIGFGLLSGCDVRGVKHSNCDARKLFNL
jgi:hypothetical protein